MRYDNAAANPNPGSGYLFYYAAPRLESYVAGQKASGGNFDVIDIAMVSAQPWGYSEPAGFILLEQP